MILKSHQLGNWSTKRNEYSNKGRPPNKCDNIIYRVPHQGTGIRHYIGCDTYIRLLLTLRLSTLEVASLGSTTLRTPNSDLGMHSLDKGSTVLQFGIWRCCYWTDLAYSHTCGMELTDLKIFLADTSTKIISSKTTYMF